MILSVAFLPRNLQILNVRPCAWNELSVMRVPGRSGEVLWEGIPLVRSVTDVGVADDRACELNSFTLESSLTERTGAY